MAREAGSEYGADRDLFALSGRLASFGLEHRTCSLVPSTSGVWKGFLNKRKIA